MYNYLLINVEILKCVFIVNHSFKSYSVLITMYIIIEIVLVIQFIFEYNPKKVFSILHIVIYRNNFCLYIFFYYKINLG